MPSTQAQALLTHAWAAPEAFAAIDALFAQDVAERAREHEDSEAGEQRQEEHKMLVIHCFWPNSEPNDCE